jgi:hypothetical protein
MIFGKIAELKRFSDLGLNRRHHCLPICKLDNEPSRTQRCYAQANLFSQEN